MSDSMRAIRDDIVEYKKLCEYFNESIRYTRNYGSMTEDCYGDHCEMLKKKLQDEYNNNIQRCPHCHEIINKK